MRFTFRTILWALCLVATLVFSVSWRMAFAEDVSTASVQIDSVKIILLQSSSVRVQITVTVQAVPGMDVAVTQERKGQEVTVAMT